MRRRLRLTPLAVSRVPARPGTYVLLRGTTPVCAGVAAGGATLRGELAAHLRGEFGPAGQAPTHFSYEPCADPLRAYAMQLAIVSRLEP